MGKVLDKFTNGWPGAASRAIDEIIISVKNGSDGDIPFGAAVFFVAGSCSAREKNDPALLADMYANPKDYIGLGGAGTGLSVWLYKKSLVLILPQYHYF